MKSHSLLLASILMLLVIRFCSATESSYHKELAYLQEQVGDSLPLKVVHPLSKEAVKTTRESNRYVAGDPVPRFSLPVLTVDGQVSNSSVYSYTPNVNGENNPVIAFAYNPQSTFCTAMWEVDMYLQELFIESPNNTQYLFLPYSSNATYTALYMYSRMQEVMLGRGMSASEMLAWNERLHFSVSSTQEMREAGLFIPELLDEWRATLTLAETWVNGNPVGNAMGRLDGRWPWVSDATYYVGDAEYPVAWFSDGCFNSSLSSLPPSQNVTNKIALIARDNTNCSFQEKVLHAQLRGAVAAVVYSDPDLPLVDMNCAPCFFYPEIAATMIPYADGMEIAVQLRAGEEVSMKFVDQYVAGFFFGMDGNSTLQEMGYLMFPSWKFIAWPAQYFNHIIRLNEEVEEVLNELEVVLFDQEHMAGPRNSTVSFPIAPDTLYQYANVYLETELECYGPDDLSCPSWDRILQLFICCDNMDDLCGMELARWITPFKRRVGQWLTPIMGVLPLISQQTCNFTITIYQGGGGYNDPWVPSVALRAGGYQQAEYVPFKTIPLYGFERSFNQQYNDLEPVYFTPPQNTSKILLVATITGHGCDNNCCSEFCITSHVFTFNNQTSSAIERTFNNAGTPEGCARRSTIGVTPNEFGTWLYGRDGWCDGQEVIPLTYDVTDQIALGQENFVLYQGLFEGQTPNPTESGAYMVVYSYLTFFSGGPDSLS